MPISKITYADKVTLNENTGIDDINKVKASDMNSIKNVVNTNADELTDLSTLVNSLTNLFFPVNKIVIFNDNDDHSDYLGFTWERIAIGKTLVGIDSSDTDFDTIGKTGGEKTHTNTIQEMPRHNHAYEDITGKSSLNGNLGRNGNNQNTAYLGVTNSIELYSQAEYRMTYTGGSQPHNNLQPYQVVAYWQRTA